MKNFLSTNGGLLLSLGMALASLAGPVACDEPSDLDEPGFGEGDVDERCVACGIKFNTNMIGKYALSELDTVYGQWHNGAVLLGVTLARVGPTTAVFAKDGQLYAKANGQTYPDNYFLGSKWSLQVIMEGVKTTAQMTIVDIKTVDGNRVYTFSHTYNGGPKDPKPVCDEDVDSPGVEFGAIVTEDITVDSKSGVIGPRAHTLYIGCLSGAVGKAAKWGYPERLVGVPAFEGAVRMVRADYCGTGDSFTIPGNPVELNDDWSINDFPIAGAPTEALWGKQGAQCIGAPRHAAAYPDAQAIQKACELLGAPALPECKPTDDLSTYGSLYWSKNP